MDAKFGSGWIDRAGSKTAAPDVLPGGEEEDRPVLNTVTPLCLDLALETGPDLTFRQPAISNEPGHGRVSPELICESEVGFVPHTKPEA